MTERIIESAHADERLVHEVLLSQRGRPHDDIRRQVERRQSLDQALFHGRERRVRRVVRVDVDDVVTIGPRDQRRRRRRFEARDVAEVDDPAVRASGSRPIERVRLV